jgi:hypothetical protein
MAGGDKLMAGNATDCRGLTVVTKRIGMTVAMIAAGIIGVTGAASAATSPARDAPSASCPDVCIAIYDPVVCLMSNGLLRKFGNACEARVYACKHSLTIIGCFPAPR